VDDASADADQTSLRGPSGTVAAAPPHTSVTPRPQPAARGAPGRLRRDLRLYIAGLAVVAAVLAASTGVLAAAIRGSSDAAQQRAAVLAAARQEAVSLTTLDHQTGARDFGAVLAGAAGSLKQQLSQGRGAFLQALSSDSVSSVGSVLDAGIVTMSSQAATVLLNVQATVHNKQTYAPETRLYHWRAGLVFSGGGWLVTSLVFV
jgi:Mce-associated membrane protein